MSVFKKLGLSKEITDVLEKMGYENPTEIQEKAIPQILNSTDDVKAFAQTGTGKTAAFSLPIIEQIDTNSRETQAIILSPTRELAIQIAKNINEFAKNRKGLSTVCVYGGSNITNQIKDLKRGAQIVVGTPGRTVDLINRRALKLKNIQWVVLDEADEMLNMGFKEDLDKVLEVTPIDKQTLLFSATFPREVERIAKNYMNNPVEITAGTKNIGADTVTHEYYLVTERNRYATLKRIVDMNINMYGVIFCRTRRETQEIADKLIQDGYSADSLHGDLSQSQRDFVMNKFRNKKLHFLVATDVAARGIDINDLTHVINHKLPDQIESYTHRSGRTGRAGKEGVSIAIISNKEKGRIRQIERLIKKNFVQKEVPTGKDICNVKLLQYVAKIKNLKVDDAKVSDNLDEITVQLKKLTKDELIKRFVYNEFETLLSYYQKAGDVLTDTTKSNRVADENMQRFFVNLGKMDELNPARMIGMINDHLDKKIDIGQIEILKSFSFFEADKTYTEEILKAFEGANRNGRRISVEKTEKPKTRSRNRDRGRDRNRGDRKRSGGSGHRKGGSGFKGGRDNKEGFKRKTEKSSRKRRTRD
ncbi:MAG: DEAD/DEAH box helicase [Flavobacteriaceae bacterium]|nr:DEAD/DEAH box helicase [Flavobacteriaceae bacterium]